MIPKKIKVAQPKEDGAIGRSILNRLGKSLVPGHVLETIKELRNQQNLSNYLDEKRFVESMQNSAKETQIIQRQPQMQMQSKFTDSICDVPRQANVEEVIGNAAAKIAKDVNANCVVSVERDKVEQQDHNYLSVKVVVFKKLKKNSYEKLEYKTKMRQQISGSILPIKELLMDATKKKYMEKGDRIVCVADESVGMGYKGLLFIFDVDKIFFNMSMLQLAAKVSADVLESVMDIAIEIGNEGREGRRIGTSFIVGSREELSKYSKQMIINPFAGCTEEARKITDPNLRETVKGFAQLDGVFMIDVNGSILSAGTHINIDIDHAELAGLDGFGTRHRYSAAITKLTDAIAVVVSESGGAVRIFKDGRLVMRLP